MEQRNALPVGTQLGGYEILAVLGRGGFGITYRVYDPNLAKVMALKEYLPGEFALRVADSRVEPTSEADRADYEWGLSRFVDEARTLARFDHPHVNKVHRFFEANGTAYMVLEYIEGETLSVVLRQERFSEAAVLQLLGEVLSGLEEVHGAGYVHRDIKPGNLMMRPDGSTVILDFGAARQAVGQRSKSITSILTPGYAPIEQYDTKAEDVGPWSDIYALGMVVYRCVSGVSDTDLPDAVTRSRARHKGSGDVEPAASIGQGRYDARLLRAIDWAMQVEEDERPRSIAEWRQALPVLAPSQGSAIPRPTPPVQAAAASAAASRQGEAGPVPGGWSRDDTKPAPSRWATVAGVGALLVAVAGGAYLYLQPPPVDGPGKVALRPPVAELRQEESPTSQGSVSAPPAPASPDPAEVEVGLELDRAERRLVQYGLIEAGQEPGPADGLFGGAETRTRQAIQAWQAAKGMEASGYLTREQADALVALGRARADDATYAAAERTDTVEAYGAYLAGVSGRAACAGSAGRAAEALAGASGGTGNRQDREQTGRWKRPGERADGAGAGGDLHDGLHARAGGLL